ncbi:xanthine phosphoribosyltransferase [Gorillibacterium sp. sgz5001074]|uniref:xanthine phosphoribosyltransferase n=1 Tax=Gorillibacterium sp. sgz5001074 TaxID=3446695 RepID=UPI003F67DA7F
MESLKQAITSQGSVQAGHVLQLDSILNHQVEPSMIMEMGEEFARRFRGEGVTKVVTIESSGIPIAFAVAYRLEVPMIFARRKKTLTTDADSYCERVPSFTKGIVTDLMISKKLLSPGDRVLIIDDIIANGDAVKGVIRILQQAECELIGLGVAVEKTFQPGAGSLREAGVRVDSLVKIAGVENGEVTFAD